MKRGRCNGRCWSQRDGTHCGCWCHGMFHGPGKAAARAAFSAVYGAGPDTVEPGQLFLFPDRLIAAMREAAGVLPDRPAILPEPGHEAEVTH